MARRKSKRRCFEVVEDSDHDAGAGVDWIVVSRAKLQTLEDLAGCVREFLSGKRPPQAGLSDMANIVSQIDR
jgi:hypothetical protein